MNRVTWGIDPGTKETAIVSWDGKTARYHAILTNPSLLLAINTNALFSTFDQVACEMVACYGMPVGKETFETVLWIGRFMEALRQASSVEMNLVYRKDIKLHFCHSMKAKDGNVAQALKDRFGPVGTKNNPGPLYGMATHKWSALAVAAYWRDLNEKKPA